MLKERLCEWYKLAKKNKYIKYYSQKGEVVKTSEYLFVSLKHGYIFP